MDNSYLRGLTPEEEKAYRKIEYRRGEPLIPLKIVKDYRDWLKQEISGIQTAQSHSRRTTARISA